MGNIKKHSDSVTPACLYRNCIQYKIPCYPGTAILIDAFTHFEVHVHLSSEIASQVRSKLYPLVSRAIFESLRRASLTLGYDYSQPVVCLQCPCEKSDSRMHIATVGEGFWICSLDEDICAALSEEQMLWCENDHISSYSLQSLNIPTLPELFSFSFHHNKINIVQEVSVKYKEFGTILLDDHTGVHVRTIEHEMNRNSEAITCRIFETWLSGVGRTPVTWTTLVQLSVD